MCAVVAALLLAPDGEAPLGLGGSIHPGTDPFITLQVELETTAFYKRKYRLVVSMHQAAVLLQLGDSAEGATKVPYPPACRLPCSDCTGPLCVVSCEPK